MRPLFVIGLFLVSTFFNASFCQAQAARTTKTTPPVRAIKPTQTVGFRGRVLTAEGPLPGAVVRVNHPSQLVVTDADGFFYLSIVPADTSTTLTVSYVGFADKKQRLDEANPELTLTNRQPLHLKRKEQTFYYLKTARKQYAKSVKHTRRAAPKNPRPPGE